MLLSVWISGCACSKNAPFKYAKEPPQAVANLRHYVKEECWDNVYDMLSQRTRDEYGRIFFKLGAPGAKIPQTDIEIAPLFNATNAEDDAFLENGDAGNEVFWYLQERAKSAEQRCHFFQILMVREKVETDDGDQKLWRLAVQDQADRKINFCAE